MNMKMSLTVFALVAATAFGQGMPPMPGNGKDAGRPPMDGKLSEYMRSVQERTRTKMEADKVKYGGPYEQIARDALTRFQMNVGPGGGANGDPESTSSGGRRPPAPPGAGPTNLIARGGSESLRSGGRRPPVPPGAGPTNLTAHGGGESLRAGGIARAGKLLATRYPDSFAFQMTVATEMVILCYRGDVVNAKLTYLQHADDPAWKGIPTIFGFEAVPTVLAYAIVGSKDKTETDGFAEVLRRDYADSYLFPPMHLKVKPVAVRDFLADPATYAKAFAAKRLPRPERPDAPPTLIPDHQK